MTKIMFDTNVFDFIFSDKQFSNYLQQNIGNYEYYVTTIQIEELCSIPDKDLEKRKSNILALAELRPKLVANSVCIFGKARFGKANFGNGIVYNNVLNATKSNVNDSIIADTAVNEDCILVTNDKKLLNKMKTNNYGAISLEEFKAGGLSNANNQPNSQNP